MGDSQNFAEPTELCKKRLRSRFHWDFSPNFSSGVRHTAEMKPLGHGRLRAGNLIRHGSGGCDDEVNSVASTIAELPPEYRWRSPRRSRTSQLDIPRERYERPAGAPHLLERSDDRPLAFA